MLFTSWLRQLRNAVDLGRTGRNHRRRSRRSASSRLQFEPLEARTVPAFLTPVDYPVGANPQVVVTADFNGDDRLDVAVSNYYSGNISVLLGNSDGTFQPEQNSTIGLYQHSLAVGDFDADGNLDLATASYSGVSVQLGNGDGSFQPGSTINNNSGPVSVAVGDFNHDGTMDLVVPGNISVFDGYYYGYYGGLYPHYHNEGVAQVLLGNGDGKFEPALTTALGLTSPRGAAVADFNGDGIDDFATVDGISPTVLVLLADPDESGSLLAPTGVATGSNPQSVLVGDLNSDGINDLVTRNSYSVSASLGNGSAGVGDGTFQPAQTTALNLSPPSVAVGDFNADGKLDLAVTSNRFVVDYSGYYGYYGHEEGQIDVLLGQGNSFFAAPETTYLGVSSLNGLASGDFNGGGFTDLAALNRGGAAPAGLLVLINDQLWAPLPPPSVSINDQTVTEGNIGSTNVAFTVSLQFAHDEDLTVHYTTADIGATAGSDYIGVSGDVTFAAGETSKTIVVEVLGDRLAELRESFGVNLTSTEAPIGDGWGYCTILDDEPTVSLSGLAYVTEGNTGTTDATFTVTLSQAYDALIAVDFATSDLTGDWQYWYGPSATADLDYVAATGTVEFAPGETSKSITVQVLGDRLGEWDEYFMVVLSGSVSAGPGSSQQALVQIVDDEPRVYVEGGSIVEGNTGTKPLSFTITLSSVSDIPVTVSYSTANGSAQAGKDYVAKTGTVSFAPGETSKIVNVQVKGDRLGEDDEEFYLNLTGATSALLGYEWGYGTIVDNEPRIRINSRCIREGNSGTKLMTFTVSLSAAYDQTVTVHYATHNDTARAGRDYEATSGTITFSPGQKSKTFTVTIKGDKQREDDEDFYILLSNHSSNSSFCDRYGWGTILDDDWPNG